MLVTRTVYLALVARAAAVDLPSTCTSGLAKIGDYMPCTDVVQHSRIDLDVQTIVSDIGVSDGETKNLAGAKSLYTTGKNSGKDVPYDEAPFRTLQSFSTKFAGSATMQAEEYHQMFYEYYGDHDWADKWVMAALDSTATNFNAGGGQAAGVAGGGNADFSTINDAATRDQCVKKGVVYMNDWHYAIHEMNAAIKACRWDSADNNNEAAHKWDEAVAFYAGSLVSTSDGDDAGSLMYGISESRGKNFKTINDDGDAANNVEVYKDFNEGLEKIVTNNCGGLRGQRDRIISQGNVPLVQGVLKYTESFNSGLKQAAEAAVFLAALQGKLWSCDQDVANTLYNELRIGRSSGDDGTQMSIPGGVNNVKSKLESTYKCLGITCPDVNCYVKSGDPPPDCVYAACTSSPTKDGIGADIVGFTPSPTISVLPHLLIDHDQKALEDFLKVADVDSSMGPYMNAHAVYSTVSFSPRRTIKGMSTKFLASEKMQKEPIMKEFYDYYGNYDYADKWVMGAILGEYVNMKGRGDADFKSMNQKDTRVQSIKKGTAYMNIVMYAIHELESAIDKCPNDRDASGHAWDEGWAFWVGELPGTTAPGNKGYLGYQLAQSRASNFNTLDANGVAEANAAMRTQFALGRQEIEAGGCSALRGIADIISNHFFIAMIQGTLKYAWESAQANAGFKYRAEAAVFMASVVPRVYKCNKDDGETLYNNLKIGSASTDFDAVKEAIERNYGCMGLTCAQIGGWLSESGTPLYRAGFAEGCTTTLDGYTPTGFKTTHSVTGDYPSDLGPQKTDDDDDSGLSDGAIAGIVVGSVVGAALLIGIVIFVVKSKGSGSDLPK